MTLMAAGPRITINKTGRKNRIIGTVSFGGRAAARFSASDMRMSRFSCDSTRIVVPPMTGLVIGLGVAATVVFGVWPGPLAALAQHATVLFSP